MRHCVCGHPLGDHDASASCLLCACVMLQPKLWTEEEERLDLAYGHANSIAGRA